MASVTAPDYQNHVAVTTDRAEILHHAGRHALSPAVRDGAPALVGTGDVVGRCGWERFFAALEERGLALVIPAPGTAGARLERIR